LAPSRPVAETAKTTYSISRRSSDFFQQNQGQ
jgi:hypothetical protein